MDIPIQIPNGTHQIIIQLPNITNQVNIPPNDITTSFGLPLALVLATFGLVGVTWYWNWRTHKTTQTSLNELKNSNDLTLQSNNLLRTEIESEYRPIISRHVHEKKIYNPKQINDDTCSILPDKIMFHLINRGRLPSIDMSYKYYLEPRDSPSKDVKLSPTDSSKSIKISSLAPSEYYSVDIPIDTINMWDTVRYDVKCYFGMIIWYSDENHRKYYYHMEGFFNKSALMLNHVDIGTFN